MSVTIFEALLNAKFNLVDQVIPGVSDFIGKEQLKNAVILLEKGYYLNDDVEFAMSGYDNINDVPNKNEL